MTVLRRILLTSLQMQLSKLHLSFKEDESAKTSWVKTNHDLFGREDSYITYQISQQNWPLFVCSVATLNLTQLPEARLKGRLRYTSARRLSPTEVSISTDAVVPWAVEIWLLQNS